MSESERKREALGGVGEPDLHARSRTAQRSRCVPRRTGVGRLHDVAVRFDEPTVIGRHEARRNRVRRRNDGAIVGVVVVVVVGAESWVRSGNSVPAGRPGLVGGEFERRRGFRCAETCISCRRTTTRRMSPLVAAPPPARVRLSGFTAVEVRVELGRHCRAPLAETRSLWPVRSRERGARACRTR